RQSHGTAPVFRAARALPLLPGGRHGSADRYATTVWRFRMPGAKVGVDQVDRLADTVRDKIVAKRTVVSEAKGPINIKVVPLGSGGFDVDITITAMSQ